MPLLDGYPSKFAAGTDFSCCNGGFVILALIAARASGTPFAQLVHERVCVRGGLGGDRLPAIGRAPPDAALGYAEVDGEWRTNALHLPVRGSGDGGAFTAVDDMHDFCPRWSAGASSSSARTRARRSPASTSPVTRSPGR